MHPKTKDTIGFFYWIVLFIALICIALTSHNASSNYDRHEWLPNWSDTDGDCQSTRQEVLIRDSLSTVVLNVSGCQVVSGTWFDPYTAQTFTTPNELDVEHIVPLGETDKFGGAKWSTEQKQAFANEIYGYNLIVVHRTPNRAKGSKPPQDWKPPNRAYWCEYARRWSAVKVRWGLDTTLEERAALAEMLGQCE